MHRKPRPVLSELNPIACPLVSRKPLSRFRSLFVPKWRRLPWSRDQATTTFTTAKWHGFTWTFVWLSTCPLESGGKVQKESGLARVKQKPDKVPACYNVLKHGGLNDD
jgi:hypothetical protein